AFICILTPLLAEEPPIDVPRARALMERAKSGVALSPEDQKYLDRVKQVIHERNAGRAPGAPGAPGTPAPGATPKPIEVSTADWSAPIPITDLAASYKGEDGGLYGGGRNDPPEPHRAAHLQESAKIRPLDAEGNPSVDGKIGLITIGFSNTSIE